MLTESSCCWIDFPQHPARQLSTTGRPPARRASRSSSSRLRSSGCRSASARRCSTGRRMPRISSVYCPAPCLILPAAAPECVCPRFSLRPSRQKRSEPSSACSWMCLQSRMVCWCVPLGAADARAVEGTARVQRPGTHASTTAVRLLKDMQRTKQTDRFRKPNAEHPR